MPLVVNVPQNSSATQVVPLPDATPTSDGMMTALQVRQLNALWTASGKTDPVSTTKPPATTFAGSTLSVHSAVLQDATTTADGVMTAAMVQQLNKLWVASGQSPITNAPFVPAIVTLNAHQRAAVIPDASPFSSGLMASAFVTKLIALSAGLSGSAASIVNFGGIAPHPSFPNGYVQLDGVAGFTGSEIGFITVSGAAQAGANQKWTLYNVNGPTSIVLLGNTLSPLVTTPDANNGKIVWSFSTT